MAFLSGPIGYMMGAGFEKHVTFNRSWKGTDHSFAFEPGGLPQVCSIHRTPQMLPSINFLAEIGQEPVFQKTWQDYLC